jgi:hypothetical protein
MISQRNNMPKDYSAQFQHTASHFNHVVIETVQYTYQNGKYIPNDPKMYQMAVIYVCEPNGHAIYLHFLFQNHPKFTKNGIFGMKLYRLATLIETVSLTRPTLPKENTTYLFTFR